MTPTSMYCLHVRNYLLSLGRGGIAALCLQLSASAAFAAPPENQPLNPKQPTTVDPAKTNIHTNPSLKAALSDDLEARAKAYYFRGTELFRDGRVPEALRAFRASGILYPTEYAAANTALCLKRLGREPEAYQAYVALLKAFPQMDPALRAEMEQKRDELWMRLGTLELKGGKPEAPVIVDGEQLGVLPLPEPILLTEGYHTIKIVDSRIANYAIKVFIVGGQRTITQLTAQPFADSGFLVVGESSSRELDVFVDGNFVGKTPWTGPVRNGNHTVVLTDAGVPVTEPLPITIENKRTALLNTLAEILDCEVEIIPQPLNARITINGAELRSGAWKGRLRGGNYAISVNAPGYQPNSQFVFFKPETCKKPQYTNRVNVSLEPEKREEKPKAIQLNSGRFVEVALGMLLASDYIPLAPAPRIRSGYTSQSNLEASLAAGYFILAREQSRAVYGANIEAAIGVPTLFGAMTINYRFAAGMMIGWATTRHTIPIATFGPGIAATYAIDNRLEVGVNVDMRFLFPLHKTTSLDSYIISFTPNLTARYRFR